MRGWPSVLQYTVDLSALKLHFCLITSNSIVRFCFCEVSLEEGEVWISVLVDAHQQDLCPWTSMTLSGLCRCLSKLTLTLDTLLILLSLPFSWKFYCYISLVTFVYTLYVQYDTSTMMHNNFKYFENYYLLFLILNNSFSLVAAVGYVTCSPGTLLTMFSPRLRVYITNRMIIIMTVPCDWIPVACKTTLEMLIKGHLQARSNYNTRCSQYDPQHLMWTLIK